MFSSNFKTFIILPANVLAAISCSIEAHNIQAISCDKVVCNLRCFDNGIIIAGVSSPLRYFLTWYRIMPIIYVIAVLLVLSDDSTRLNLDGNFGMGTRAQRTHQILYGTLREQKVAHERCK